ncbi:protein SMAX1-LIKE 3-like [Cucurbita pepo subsp. pepo]|uniref:protein SMAX1-LIKE 3-like n=1 Tax=Cucurbita pepo subsp. pepo TaxID=3664 RepID=UPI000C9D6198|nr:protein SMAX1-LIKE 3-like [Cucurbita pepo subsp. pepo]
MRAGICTIQLQALSVEAEATVKQAIGLARRRGHAHVTPLHVASAMLVSSSGLLRRACLHCHSHPLQCKALELCFNVALNRLPTSTPNPLFGPQYPNPCLSNALVAAFKRAQAHQRRGSIENQQQHQQQQPILALKIELEQLIISILDDPSVSRVMREAGFSSIQVKNNVEKALSLEEYNNERHYFCEKNWNLIPTNTSTPPNLAINTSKSIPFTQFGINATPNHQKEISNVLEQISIRISQGRRIINTVIIGESLGIAEAMIRGAMEKFEKGEVPKELKDVEFLSLPLFSLRNLSKEEIEQKVLELKCIVKSCMGKRVIFYLGDLKWVAEFWSNYEQRSHYSPVEQLIMELKTLIFHGNNEGFGRFWVMGIATFQIYMKCKAGRPSLESLWSLQPLAVPVGSLSLSLSFESQECNFPTIFQPFDARKSDVITDEQDETCDNFGHYNFLGLKQSPKEYQFWDENPERDVVSKPDLLSNPNSSPNSASTSEVVMEEEDQEDDCLKTIPNCSNHKVDEISATILQCRSKNSKNSYHNHHDHQESCCLLFIGNEEQSQSKEQTARELAKFFFGSQTKLISISLSSFNHEKSQEHSKKRTRDELGSSYLQRFAEAVNENPHRLFFMEDIQQIDHCSLMGIKEAIQKGSVKLSDGEFCPLKDAIIVFDAEERTIKQEQEQEHQHERFVSLDLNIAVEDSNGDRIRWIMEEFVDGKILFS